MNSDRGWGPRAWPQIDRARVGVNTNEWTWLMQFFDVQSMGLSGIGKWCDYRARVRVNTNKTFCRRFECRG